MKAMWRDPVDQLLRILFVLVMMCATFVLVFVAVFVPLLMYEGYLAPHDGQGGMGGFFLGLPTAAIAALVSCPFSYSWAAKRSWFARSESPEEVSKE
jgi:uncharacterized membrane protein